MSDSTSTQTPAANDQFLRKASLLVGSETSTFDLSNLRFKFNITMSDTITFNLAVIRVYNPSAQTVGAIIGNTGVEYTKVIVQAGYENGSYGAIFNGTIKQFGHGKESNVDSFLDIYAADGDLANYAYVSATLDGQVTQGQQIDAINKVLTPYGVVPSQGSISEVGGIIPRGKVMMGLSIDKLRQLGKTRLSTFSIQNGVLTEIPLTGYLLGEIVVINSQTGLIGTPEATQNGITLTALLNPKIAIGNRIQLNNKEINQTIISDRSVPGNIGAPNIALFASEAADGIYRVCVHEYSGDTRGNDWYSHLTVLAIDPSANPDGSVNLY